MNNAIDQNINKFFKGFLTTKQGGFEDPTYLGFRLVFDFTPNQRNLETGQTDDPLFAEDPTLESAIRYLEATGYPNRAGMLRTFKANLQYINKETPWYFQTISGLNDIWKIEFGENFNPFRGKDKVLEIACLESIDLRITALADLYRKATFDAKYMRSLVPENLRWFTVRVQLAEIRQFQRVKSSIDKINGNIVNQNPNTEDFTSGAALSDLAFTGSSASTDPEIENIDNLVSLMEFHLSHCTFDFWESFPSDKEISMNGEMEMAKQKFKIHVGHIKEQHQYKLLDLVLKDGLTGENGNNLKSIPDFDKAFNNRPDNILKNTISGIGSSLQDKLNQIAGVPANLISRGVNAAGAAITTQVLGNVYDLRNQSLQTIFNAFVGQAQQLVGNVLPTIQKGAQSLTDVFPNVPGSDLITKSTANMGNALPTPATRAANLNENLGNVYK